MMKFFAALSVSLFLLVGTPAHAQLPGNVTTQVVDVLTPTSPQPIIIRQTRIRYLFMTTAPNPKLRFAAILFAGGNGLLGITNDGQITTTLAGNFLVRSAKSFAQNGIAVAVVDAPNATALTEADRLSTAYATTMTAVIADLRARTNAGKVWLIGTSSGTLSAKGIAAAYPHTSRDPFGDQGKGRPDGIVLTATQTNTYDPALDPAHVSTVKCTRTVLEPTPALAAINVPAYVVSNTSDLCPCTPSGQATNILNALTSSPAKAAFAFTNASTSGADVCSAYTPHGFYSIESQVVANIAAWVKAH